MFYIKLFILYALLIFLQILFLVVLPKFWIVHFWWIHTCFISLHLQKKTWFFHVWEANIDFEERWLFCSRKFAWFWELCEYLNSQTFIYANTFFFFLSSLLKKNCLATFVWKETRGDKLLCQRIWVLINYLHWRFNSDNVSVLRVNLTVLCKA